MVKKIFPRLEKYFPYFKIVILMYSKRFLKLFCKK